MAQLLERAGQLTALRELFDDARGGHGHVVCVCAEAGGGKSSLIQSFSDAIASQANVLTGWCDPFATPRPAGPLLDMGAGLGSTVVQILRDEGRTGLFDAVQSELRAAARPTVLVIEDVHWADGTTLDLLRFLGRRITQAPALVIVTYRDDEVGPDHPLRTVLGDLATQRGLVRVECPPLSLNAISELTSARGADPHHVLEVTGGNPFFVTELVASEGFTAVPESVADTVLARLGRLSASARHAVTVCALFGARAEPSVLYDVPGVSAAAMDEAVHAGLMRFTPPCFVFRHELVRQAVLSVTSRSQQRALAGEVLAVMRRRANEDDALARLAELAEIADDAAAVAEFAPAAARRAAELGAHRQAAAQYERALRQLAGADPAPLWEAMAVELYLTGDLDAAITARSNALDLRRKRGEVRQAGDNLRWLGRLHWYYGDSAVARAQVDEAMTTLEPLGPSPELALATSFRSQLLMLSADYVDAVTWGMKALDLANDLAEVRAHALNNVGTARSGLGDKAGLELVAESLSLSLREGFEDHAARAYVNLAWRTMEIRELRSSRRWAEAGIRYCEDRDLDLQIPYLTACLARVCALGGHWSEASELCESLLLWHDLSAVHEFVAQTPLALIAIRRGDAFDLQPLAAAAAELADLQRLAPFGCLEAEQAWLAGRTLAPDSLAVRTYAEYRLRHTGVELVELAVWLDRCGIDVDPAHLAMAAGPDQLHALGNEYDAAVEWLLRGDEAAVRRAAEIFGVLGAAPAFARAQARLREMGATHIPRGRRPSTVANDFGLTGRQVEVLQLLSEGMSNAEIAGRLYLSERTVEHHVSAVLAKSGAESREEAARKYRYRHSAK